MTQEVASTVREERFQSDSGLNIFFRSWRPATQARAVVVIIPGFNSHSGYYQWVAEQLTAGGLAVYAVDLRGRGQSDGERFYVDKFTDYVDDAAHLVALAKMRDRGLPVFLLGHSAGGVVSCLYTLEHQPELAGLICESFAFQVPAPDFAPFSRTGVCCAARAVLPSRTKTSREIRRRPPRMRIAHRARDTAHADPGEMVRADERQEGIPAHHAARAHPSRHAGQSYEAGREPALFRHGRIRRQDAEALRGRISRPLHDIDREAVMADIRNWIDSRLRSST
jgi:alpha-beta hydrolase superfamily lysophospholipase